MGKDMGLKFFPKILPLPSDHPIYAHMDRIPDRFEKQKILKDWIIEGPFHDDDRHYYYFMLTSQSMGTHEEFKLDEGSFLFNEKAVDGMISKLIARCMEVELQMGTAQRLLGASQEEVNRAESSDTYVIQDFSRGTGEATHRRTSCNDADASRENKGGLILPA